MKYFRFVPLILILLFTASCGSASMNGRATAASLDDEDGFLQLVNEFRSRSQTCGNSVYPAVDPLIRDRALSQAATDHSQDMAGRSSLSHLGGDGSSFTDRSSRAGYRGCPLGENVAYHSGTTANPEQVFAQWRSSAGHCRNMMLARAEEFGFGSALGTSPANSRSAVYYTLVLGATSCN